MISNQQHPASFRDPSGFIFDHEGKFYRQVNQVYAADYELLKSSGLYGLLAREKKMLSHTEFGSNITGMPQWYNTLLPQQLSFISYPYEWCFSQWKDAALLTLELVKTSIAHGMILKDATPFNIQFIDGAPIFIDTLSFEKYDATKPWVAYRQFVECFLGPLLIARYKGADLLKTFQVYPDGVPLQLISKLLPFKSAFNVNVFMHIMLPGLLGAPGQGMQKKTAPFSQQKLLNIISNLYAFVSSLSLRSALTKWNNYYDETILSNEYASAKMKIVESWLKDLPGKTVLDIGTNTGLFSIVAAAMGKSTIAVDADEACVDTLYKACKGKNIRNLLPLVVDITNPSPSIGWNNGERSAFMGRAHAHIGMALALVHHLAIGKNIPLQQIAALFSRLADTFIVEFIPKEDPRVQLLLRDRVDVFSNYSEQCFIKAFKNKFEIQKQTVVPGTNRVLFLMKPREALL